MEEEQRRAVGRVGETPITYHLSLITCPQLLEEEQMRTVGRAGDTTPGVMPDTVAGLMWALAKGQVRQRGLHLTLGFRVKDEVPYSTIRGLLTA